mmetsp:Transcript_11393/g.27871  ORF Transcript_11393/g.27871 Transcript_11393/m.27871 type:complete len:283 (+) Transcript_11393:32-880(+)
MHAPPSVTPTFRRTALNGAVAMHMHYLSMILHGNSCAMLDKQLAGSWSGLHMGCSLCCCVCGLPVSLSLPNMPDLALQPHSLGYCRGTPTVHILDIEHDHKTCCIQAGNLDPQSVATFGPCPGYARRIQRIQPLLQAGHARPRVVRKQRLHQLVPCACEHPPLREPQPPLHQSRAMHQPPRHAAAAQCVGKHEITRLRLARCHIIGRGDELCTHGVIVTDVLSLHHQTPHPILFSQHLCSCLHLCISRLIRCHGTQLLPHGQQLPSHVDQALPALRRARHLV